MKAPTFYHGGPAGLRVGDIIRPAISIGREHAPSRHQPHYSPHKVYVTQDHAYAHFYAAAQNGTIYEVRPIPRAVEVDPDARNSFTCGAAEIVAIYDMLPADTDAWTERITRMKGTL